MLRRAEIDPGVFVLYIFYFFFTSLNFLLIKYCFPILTFCGDWKRILHSMNGLFSGGYN